MGEHFHPAEKFAQNFIRLNAKEVLDLRARGDTAIPFVKPTITGRGMNLTTVPRPVAPRITSNIPASDGKRHRQRKSHRNQPLSLRSHQS
jgi:hypothetical protein